MAKKAGRPPGAQNKVGKDQKEFIRALLGDTQEQMRDVFTFYANSAQSNPDDRKKFADLYVELTKMIVPKPVEVDATIKASDFEQLLGICSRFDDE